MCGTETYIYLEINIKLERIEQFKHIPKKVILQIQYA